MTLKLTSNLDNIKEDFLKLKSKISWSHFGLDDFKHENKIPHCILEMVYMINELQDQDFDLVIHKALELKHLKNNLKRNVQET